jgi:hypothetical protein
MMSRSGSVAGSGRWTLVAFATCAIGLTAGVAQQGATAGRVPAPAEVALLSAPGADTLGRLRGGTSAEVIEERAGWLRVRLEGWVPVDAPLQVRRGTETDLGLLAVREDPDRHRGAVVRWRVQYIGLQRADSLRSDMPRGQPYLLARDPGGAVGFVYVTVPQQLLPAVTGLAPLQRIEIRGRVVTGRSPLTGHPILELLEVVP